MHYESRYVFYDDGRFGLQFSSARAGFFEYRGRFARTDSPITLTFDDSNTAGPWLARAVVDGDLPTVEYNLVMWLADFAGGTYVWSSDVR